MAAATGKAQCITCGKERATLKCAGCSQDFCYTHSTDHRQELSTQLDEIEVHRDLFRQTLTEQTTDPHSHPLIKQIDQWEENSIKIIRQTAEECRQLLFQHITEHITHIEVNFAKITDQLRQTRQENDFNEIDLDHFKQKLSQLIRDLDKPLNVSIQQDPTTLINKISVVTFEEQININTKWRQNAITVAGGNEQGNGLNQLSSPEGIFIDDDNQCIYIADYFNHRIVEWKYDATTGQVVAGGNGEGRQNDQLNCPTAVILDKRNGTLIICDYGNKRIVRWPRQNGINGQTIIAGVNCSRLAMDNNGDLYTSDPNKNEVRRWKIGEPNGTVVAGANGQGNRLNQLNYPGYIFVDEDHSVYVSDCDNHRVMKWLKDATEGIVVAGGQGQGNNLTQLFHPRGVIVDQLGHVYVGDSENNRIMRWLKGAREGSLVVGGNGLGQQPNQFSYLRSLSFDRQGNLYAVDRNNGRVQKFIMDSN